ncbi:Glu-tRNA(Gln) amidotransferase GatDE subunit D, partial [Methanosarcinales archaeon ex4484_138]
MPTTTENMVIKLDNGYNIGFDPKKTQIQPIKKREEIKTKAKPPLHQNEDLPLVSILSTGGTIASRVDYRTGAVTSQFTAEDILTAIPELSTIAQYNSQVVYTILSENMRPEYWIKLAQAVHNEIKNGAEGVIITHGTDTMTYTAAADTCYIHRGTKVRKMHTSRRDAFQSINTQPIATINYPERRITTHIDYTKRGEKKLTLNARLEPKVALIKYAPDANPDVIDHYIENDYKGIVIEGTGLGHVGTDWIPRIKDATEKKIPVVITSQCI